MNQPTREEFNELKEEQRQLKEEVRKLREQVTEPITIPRIELDPGGIQNRLDNHTELLREISQKQGNFATDVEELKIDAKAYTGDAAIFKNKVERVESDVSTIKSDVDTIKTVQNGHSKYFEEHGRRLAAMATKDDLATMKNELLDAMRQLLQQHPSE